MAASLALPTLERQPNPRRRKAEPITALPRSWVHLPRHAGRRWRHHPGQAHHQPRPPRHQRCPGKPALPNPNPNRSHITGCSARTPDLRGTVAHWARIGDLRSASSTGTRRLLALRGDSGPDLMAAGLRDDCLSSPHPRNRHAQPCLAGPHRSPTSPCSRRAHHRKPTDETGLRGTRRHSRYDGGVAH